MKVLCLLVLVVCAIVKGNDYVDDTWMHRFQVNKPVSRLRSANSVDAGAFWTQKAQALLNKKLRQLNIKNKAKNVILFIGDGMSIPTLKAARIYLGQMFNETGEDRQLAFEKFPTVGLSKTYCIDKQVPDSACTATAYLCGIKARAYTIGVTGSVYLDDCAASLIESNQVTSIAKWAQLKNKRTGLVTTTRVTHASPAGVFANVANRDWECDADKVPSHCSDIAYQMIHHETGKNLNVIMGGGRSKFLPKGYVDEEKGVGKRLDGKNLIQDWLDDKANANAQYIWNRSQLLKLSYKTDYVLGLFEPDHMLYHLESNDNEPTLEEMTEAAIRILNNGNGFFLFVEGGRIDHGHHDNWAKKALDETVEFSKAIQKAYDITDERETLIVVTSDHSHVMTISGYADIGNDIFGSPGLAGDGHPYSTISYANGPGYKANVNNHRYDTSNDDTHNNNYRFPATSPLSSETHGGDDVGIFASGPWSHLFSGVIEQNAIPHLMAFAACVGNGRTACD